MFGKAFANSFPLQITFKNRNFHKGANNSVLICISGVSSGWGQGVEETPIKI